MREGFQLDFVEIGENIRTDVAKAKDDWSLRTYFDSFARPDFKTGMTWVHDLVDVAVVVFVGTREQAASMEAAVREVLAP